MGKLFHGLIWVAHFTPLLIRNRIKSLGAAPEAGFAKNL
jgi:hypothetical protein